MHIPPFFTVVQKLFGTATLHGNKIFSSLKYEWIGCSCIMQNMEYAPNSPSIQKRFGTAILHGNKMFPSLECDWI